MIDVSLSISSLALRKAHQSISGLEPQLWRDPSDRATLFQDAAGLVPVTLAGDPVRRVSNKGTLGGYYLAPSGTSAPVYQTDGTRHWLESDGADDTLVFQGAVPFSAEVFEAVAFRTLGFSRAFAHIVSNRGSGGGDLKQRHPLIFTLQSDPGRVVCSFGGIQSAVDTGASLVGVDTLVTTSNSAAGILTNVNGNTLAQSGAPLEDGGSEPYRVSGPNPAHIRDYGGLHMNRVPNSAEEAMITQFYAMKSGATS